MSGSVAGVGGVDYGLKKVILVFRRVKYWCHSEPV